MLFPEEDAPHLKKWIVKRLENTSDADADVLADYVLALLRHDGDIDTVRRLCEEEIPDFLKEDSATFVRDVFEAILYRSYLPGTAALPRPVASYPISTAPSGPSYSNQVLNAYPPISPNGSRKRAFTDRGDVQAQTGRELQYGGDPNDRMYKQPRRENIGPAGYDSFGNFRGPRQSQGRPPQISPRAVQSYPNMPSIPNPPPGMLPIDPSNPMAALMAMQALGFPAPGLPPYSNTGAPIDLSRLPGAGFPSARRTQRCRDYDTKGFCARGNSCKFEHGTDSIYVPPPPADEYDPTNASLMLGIEQSSTSPFPPAQIGAPQYPFQNFRGNDRGRGGSRGGANTNPSRRGGRADFSSDRPNYDKSKTTIVVENIPEEKFTEDDVRGFFSQFGNILEVSMRPYKRLAIVKYETWDSAKDAYSSPKVIFDNRFVKVYWYTNDQSLPQAPATGANGTAANEENRDMSAAASSRAPSEPKIDIEEFARKQQEVQKAHEEKMKKKAEMEAAREEMNKRQEELLKRQAEEKRKLMEKLAAKSAKAGTPPGGMQNGESTEGKPTSQAELLKAQLAALEAEAQSLGIDTASSEEPWSGRGRGRGRGGYRGRGAYVPRGGDRGGYRGRGGAPFSRGGGAYKLDNRPKKIAITGADFTNPEKDESLRQYLLGIGEFTEIETTPDKTLITFKDRFTAEKFMYGIPNGELPAIGKVEMVWIQSPLPPVNIQKPQTSTKLHDDGLEQHMGDGGDDASEQSHDHPPQDHRAGHRQERRERQELDYDVADDNEWPE